MKKNHNADLLRTIQEEFEDEFYDDRALTRLNARQQIGKAQEIYKKSFDKKRKKEIKHIIGDLVAIKRTQFTQGKKIRNDFLGPYKITKVKPFGRYDVEKMGEFDGPNKTSTSSDLIKPWRYFD